MAGQLTMNWKGRCEVHFEEGKLLRITYWVRASAPVLALAPGPHWVELYLDPVPNADDASSVAAMHVRFSGQTDRREWQHTIQPVLLIFLIAYLTTRKRLKQREI